MSDTLVIQTAWLGDVVLTTPLLRALAARFGPVDVVTTPRAAALLEPHPAVSRVVPFDKRGRDRGVPGLLRLARTLRQARYRRAVLAQDSWRSALLARLAGIPERIGFADRAARLLYTGRVPRRGAHEAHRLLGLAGGEGPTDLTLALTAADHAQARAALHGVRGPEGRLVVLAPESARATKRWPYYPQLAARLTDRAAVAVIGTDHDPAGAVPAFAAPALDLRGRLSVRAAAAVMARASVAVTNDSAPLHFAQAVGTPVVALFGPTAPAQGFGPRGPLDAVREVRALACRPCSTHGTARCPRGHHRCLRDLSVETVFHAVERVLARSLPAPDGAATATCV